MRELYLAETKKHLLSSSENIKNIFTYLINYIEIPEIKKFPEFDRIKKFAIKNLSAQDLFGRAAIFLVRKKNLLTLKFLIEECRFNFKHTKDENGCTLLHEACLYGATNIVEFFLEKGFDANVKDDSGATPLHRAAEFKENASLIAILKKYKANMNAKDNNGMAPIHCAAAHGNFIGITALKDAGANTKLRYDEMTYIDISRNIKSGKSIVSPLPLLQTDEKIEGKIKSIYYQGILQTKFLPNNFHDVVLMLTEQNETLNQEEAIMLVDSYVLANFSSSFNMDIFKNFILDQINHCKLTLADAYFITLRPSIILLKSNFTLPVEQLTDVSLMLVNKEKNISTEVIEIYNCVALSYNQIGAYPKAEQAMLQALNVLSDKIAEKTRAFVFYNLGRSQKYQMKIEESQKSFEKAFELLNNDSDIFRAHLISLLETKNYKQAYVACQSSRCGDFSRISYIYVSYLAGGLSCSNALEAIQGDFKTDVNARSLMLDIKTACYMELKNYELALEASEAKFSQAKSQLETTIGFDVGYAIAAQLKIYIECERCDEGLIFLNNCIEEYPINFSCNLSVMSFAALIYAANHMNEKAEALIDKIHAINSNYSSLSIIYLQMGIEAVVEKSFDLAVHYFDLALKIDAEILDNFKVESVDVSQAKNLESEIEATEYDAVRIHDFFQTQKKQMRLDLSQTLLPNYAEAKSTWTIKNSIFTQEDSNLIAVDSDFYPNYYAVIDPYLKLEEKVLNQFQIALSKGLCKRSMAQNGIKFLKNSIIELKIDENIRLYTTVIYKNQEDMCLIVFDKIGNHESIKKLLREKQPLEIVDVSEQHKEVSLLSNYQGTFFENTTPKITSNINNSNNEDISQKSHGFKK